MLFCGSRQLHINNWKYKSLVVDFSQDHSSAFKSIELVYFSVGASVKLQCSSSFKENNVILWKKVFFNRSKIIALWTKSFPDNIQTFDNEYLIDIEGSLLITSVQIHHEGNFTCIAPGNVEDAVKSFQVVVLVPPSPPFLTVSGCHTLEKCIIVSTGSGEVTCSVSGVRPIVSLEWSTEDKLNVHFQKEDTSIKETSDIFYVSTTLYYNLSSETECGKTSFVRCSAHGLPTSTFSFVREVELINAKCFKKGHTAALWIKPVLITIVICVSVGLFSIGGLLMFLSSRSFNDTKKEENKDDCQIPLVDITDKSKFIEELNITYDELLQNHFTSNETLPYFYIQNRLFLNTEQKLSSSNTSDKDFLSHRDLFHRADIKARHILIEGEPGQGKTSLFRHFMNIWLNSLPDSPLISFDILIMLSLKDFPHDMTFFDVIARKLLATDSNLTSGKIEAILRREKRYLVLLDDFEQYPDAQYKKSIIHKIMRREVMRNAKVILFTRPTYLTKKLGNAVAFVRLDGFTEEQVDRYVSLAFKEHKEIERSLKEKLKEDQNIASMCQTPFLLSLCSYVFMNSQYEKKTFESITSFFEKVLTTLSYRYYKPTVTNWEFESSLKQKSAKEIAKFAIESIRGSQPARSIENISTETNVSHFDAITEVGIIVHTHEIPKQFHSNTNEWPNFKFIHDLFQYFFGALYLACYASSEEFEDYLKSIDVYSSQQLLVFTCGLSQDEAVVDKIVRYLLKKKDHYPFEIRDCIVLCLMEVTCHDWNERKELLNELCTKEYALSIRHFDSTKMKNAKAFLINTCSTLSVPFNVISLSLVVQKMENNSVLLDTDVCFNLPRSIKTFSVRDFQGRFEDKDAMFLIENTENLEEIVIFSNLIPSVCTKQALNKIKIRGIQVIWVTLKDDCVVNISLPSTLHNFWLTYTEIGTIMYLRYRGQWQNLSKEMAHQKGESVLAQLKKMGFKRFLQKSRSLNIIERKALIKFVNEDMKTITGLANEWVLAHEAINEESEKKHLKKFNQHIAKLQTRLEMVQKREGREKTQSTSTQPVQATVEYQQGDRMRSFSADLKNLIQEMQL